MSMVSGAVKDNDDRSVISLQVFAIDNDSNTPLCLLLKRGLKNSVICQKLSCLLFISL